jgi:hypothetical protein
MFMVTLPWVSTKCLLTWKPKITPQGRLLCQLAPSMPRIDEIESGSSQQMWPTPQAADHKNMDTAKQTMLSSEVKLWPTPTTRDHKGGYQGGRIRNGKVSMDTLDVAVQHTDNQQKTGGQLNPQWVEWLMGYPEGWTDLKG